MRWAFGDKSYKISQIKKDIKNEKFIDWILLTDKINVVKMTKDNMIPFEKIFFEVGAEILKNVKGFMAANPDKAVQSMIKQLDKSISDIKSGGDINKIKKIKSQLDKINSMGGLNAIVPSEGIVFKYNGNIYKFTGAFAPVNQITGLAKFG
jgi:deoxyribose-phosphate aldolase